MIPAPDDRVTCPYHLSLRLFTTVSDVKIGALHTAILPHVWHDTDREPEGETSARIHAPRWPSGKASASRAEDPGLESRLRRDFFGVESYQ